MAQKVTGYIKLQIPAGKATPAPPVVPALGQHGVDIMAFTKEFNERTKNDVGMIIPVIITVYADRSFTFVTKPLRLLYSSKKSAKSNPVLVYQTKPKLQKSQKHSCRKSLRSKCQTSMLQTSNLL